MKYISHSEGHPVDSDEMIYRTISKASCHRLKTRDKLPEASFRHLAVNASQRTVRKVLQRLAQDHIVELRPNRGASVAAPTPEQRARYSKHAG